MNQNNFLKKEKTLLGLFWEMLEIALIAIAIIIPVRYFLIQPFYVKGASMEPNYYDHEYLIIDELSYRLREPRRGEVAVFRYPNDPSQFFIKRIIGLPGESIKVSGGKVTVSVQEHPAGYNLDESQYLEDAYTYGEVSAQLKNNEYFVMGDNRNSSFDSRAFGPVGRSNIVGRALFRGWPLDKAGLLINR